MSHSKTLMLSGAVAAALLAMGCYEDLGPQTPPTPQTQAAPVQQGPITSHGSQGGGSALGGAKQAATNIIDRAEQQSQDLADQFDRSDD